MLSKLNSLYDKSDLIDQNKKVENKIISKMNKYKFKRPYLKSIKYSLNILLPLTVVLHN